MSKFNKVSILITLVLVEFSTNENTVPSIWFVTENFSKYPRVGTVPNSWYPVYEDACLHPCNISWSYTSLINISNCILYHPLFCQLHGISADLTTDLINFDEQKLQRLCCFSKYFIIFWKCFNNNIALSAHVAFHNHWL